MNDYQEAQYQNMFFQDSIGSAARAALVTAALMRGRILTLREVRTMCNYRSSSGPHRLMDEISAILPVYSPEPGVYQLLTDSVYEGLDVIEEMR